MKITLKKDFTEEQEALAENLHLDLQEIIDYGSDGVNFDIYGILECKRSKELLISFKF